MCSQLVPGLTRLDLVSSLGGHATWIAGSRDPRITHLCPIIGSPSTTSLLKDRAIKYGLEYAPPTFPRSLQTQLDRTDPLNLPVDVWNGKDIMIISAGEDGLVNFYSGASDKMVTKLQNGGHCQVDTHIEPNVKHTVTLAMVERCAQWLAERALV